MFVHLDDLVKTAYIERHHAGVTRTVALDTPDDARSAAERDDSDVLRGRPPEEFDDTFLVPRTCDRVGRSRELSAKPPYEVAVPFSVRVSRTHLVVRRAEPERRIHLRPRHLRVFESGRFEKRALRESEVRFSHLG